RISSTSRSIRSAAKPRERATAQARSSSSARQRWQIASMMAFLDEKKRYTLAGDILSSEAMSATAVFAKPSRRNSASAVSMMRARVSSALTLTCGFIGFDLGQYHMTKVIIRHSSNVNPRGGLPIIYETLALSESQQ